LENCGGCRLGRHRGKVGKRYDRRNLSTDQINRQRRQSVIVVVCPAILYGHVLPVDKAGLLQAQKESGVKKRSFLIGDEAPRYPMTGIADCCARAARGHVATPPPKTPRNSRRLISILDQDRITVAAKSHSIIRKN